jgi:outer membrane protein assembly factor BamB
VMSERSNQVLRYDGASGAFLGVFVAAGSGGLDIAENLTFGPDGNLYVCSLGSSQVLKYDGRSGAFLGIFVTAGSGGLAGPTGLLFGADGNLYVNSSRGSQVLRYDGASGAFRGVFVAAGSGGLETPVGIALGADGNLYVSSLGTSEVLRYDGASGAFLGVFVPQGSGGLDGAYDLAFGPDGNLYVNSFSNGEVLRYDAGSGAFLGVFAGGNGLLGPTYLLFAPVGNTACQDDATHVCLQQGRFRVTTGWQTAAGAAGAGQAVPLSADTAYFWFFAASNVELMVKVLDGCPAAAGGHYWVFAGGLTDVAVQLTVTDTATGAVKTYLNPQSTPFAPLQDTSAFACH